MNGREPLYERLRRQLRQQIATGRWQPGDRLPTEQALAATYGVSSITVRRALRDLVLEGVVVRRVPAGTFVAPSGTRSHLLGVATLGVDLVDSLVFGPMLLGMQAAAGERARLQLLTAPVGMPRAAWLQRLADAHDVEGVIVVTAAPLSYEDVAPLDVRGFPYVLVNRRIPGHAVWAVVLNDHALARQAVDYLYARGHRRIAHIAGPPDVVTAADRLRGVLEGLHAHDLLPSPLEAGGAVPAAALVAYARYNYGSTLDDESGYVAMRTLLARTPPPTAIFAAADGMAVGAYRALKEAGLRVPDDVSVIGVTNLPLVALLDPPLTTFDHQLCELGRRSVDLLLDQVEGRVPPSGTGAAEPASRLRVVEAVLVERGSCRAVGAEWEMGIAAAGQAGRPHALRGECGGTGLRRAGGGRAARPAARGGTT